MVLYPGAEVLDVAGPCEVFGAAAPADAFRVQTVAEDAAPVALNGGLTAVPDAAWGEATSTDLLVVPGGAGTSAQLDHAPLTDYVRSAAANARVVFSVCTGALLLARAGLVGAQRITTHQHALDDLAALAPNATIERDQRFVATDGLVTSAGVTAGIDAALHVLKMFCGVDVAREAARYLEHQWAPPSVAASFPVRAFGGAT